MKWAASGWFMVVYGGDALGKIQRLKVDRATIMHRTSIQKQQIDCGGHIKESWLIIKNCINYQLIPEIKKYYRFST